jgi:hypothetical protein
MAYRMSDEDKAINLWLRMRGFKLDYCRAVFVNPDGLEIPLELLRKGLVHLKAWWLEKHER